MSLLEKAEKILKNTNKKENPDSILLTEEDLIDIKRVKIKKEKLITKAKVRENIKNKIKGNKVNINFDYELTPIKIQENEIEKLFKKKQIKYGNKIEVLDILLSNFKIFQSQYKNFLTFESLLDFIIKNVKNYLFIDRIYFFSNKFKIMNQKSDKYVELEKLILKNEQFLIFENNIINLKTKFKLKEDIFFFKTNIQGNLNIMMFFQITLKELKINEYFFDILTLFIDNIANYIYNLYQTRSINIEPAVNSLKKAIEKIKNKNNYKIIIVKILNFPAIIHNLQNSDLQNLLKLLDVFYKSYNFVNINYKTIFFEININKNIKNNDDYNIYEKNILESFKSNFRLILQDYEILTNIEPVFKIKKITNENFNQSIISFFLSL